MQFPLIRTINVSGTSGTVTVNANSYVDYVMTLPQYSGWTPIGVASYNCNYSYAGVVVAGCTFEQDKITVTLRNTTATSRSGVGAVTRVMYMRSDLVQRG